MDSSQNLTDAIQRQFTPILVFGVGGRIGSGASFVGNALTEELKAFGYTVKRIRVTDLALSDNNRLTQWLCMGEDFNTKRYDGNADAFESMLGRFGLKCDALSPEAKRVLILQKNGNLLRQKYHSNFLAAVCIDHIAKDLRENRILDPPTRRIAYIIDSLKNPAEVQLLQTVFGKCFIMIGVVADDAVQKRRLSDQKQFTSREFAAVSEIDAGETEDYGQHATETILTADYFFENNYDKETKIKSECARLLNLVFETVIETPRRDEFGMYMAFIAADKSACLSRQVGASIVGADGSVLATGHNDVPRFGGGLYSSES